jgi:hypothetical protein
VSPTATVVARQSKDEKEDPEVSASQEKRTDEEVV